MAHIPHGCHAEDDKALNVSSTSCVPVWERGCRNAGWSHVKSPSTDWRKIILLEQQQQQD